MVAKTITNSCANFIPPTFRELGDVFFARFAFQPDAFEKCFGSLYMQGSAAARKTSPLAIQIICHFDACRPKGAHAGGVGNNSLSLHSVYCSRRIYLVRPL